MNKYEFKTINLIAETFEKQSINFEVVSHDGIEQLLSGLSIDCGPNVIVRFVNCDNDNAVAVRILGLISNIPKEKRFRIMEACNVLNCKLRYLKFNLDTDGNVNAEYDFLQHSPDEGIGEMALELFVRIAKILNAEYSIFMKALYSDEELDITVYS